MNRGKWTAILAAGLVFVLLWHRACQPCQQKWKALLNREVS